MGEAPVGARAMRRDRPENGAARFRYSLPRPVIKEEIGGIDIGGDPALLPFSTSRSVPSGMPTMANTSRRSSALGPQRSIGRRLGHLDGLVRFERLNQFPAGLGWSWSTTAIGSRAAPGRDKAADKARRREPGPA